jgi:ketosteroid isomerase-like protein
MTNDISRDSVETFLAALATRDPQQIGPWLADDIDWLLTGPTELFPYCGQRLGKEAVLDAYRLIGNSIRGRDHAREQVLVDGDCAATLTRIMGLHESGREIALRIATFMRFRDGLAVEMCTIMDSLGIAEQVLGRPLDLTPAALVPQAVEILEV